jgi:predicted permease
MSILDRLFGGGRHEVELDKEVRFHLEEHVADLQRQGFGEDEAWRQARLQLGGAEQTKEQCRDERRTRWIEDFFRDAAFGWRMLKHSPAFTGAAVLSLGLGIGANVAIFSLIDHMMLRMMPVREPERLVEVHRYRQGRSSFSMDLFNYLRMESRSFEDMFAHAAERQREIDLGGNIEQVNVEFVSGSYYSVLGIGAAVGRTFSLEVDAAPGAHPVALISHAWWRRRFNSDPAVVGKTFRVNETVFTIIGVTPPDFHGTALGRAPEITFPLSMVTEVRQSNDWLYAKSYNWLSIMARLRPNQTIEQASAEVQALLARKLEVDHAGMTDERRRKAVLSQYFRLEPAGSGFDEMRQKFSEPLKMLMGLVGLVLMIACANIANLLLARSAARQREIGVRLAIGAKRSRIVRQLITEGLLLAALGGVFGLALAYWFADGLVTLMSNRGPRMALQVPVDLRVTAFAAAITIFCCLLFSVAPALHATRNSIRTSRRWRLGKTLVIAQLAICVMLLVGAGLFGRSLLNFYQLDAGFERKGLLMFSVNAAKAGYQGEQLPPLRERIISELRAIPGVESVSVAALPPLSGGGWDGDVRVQGYAHASASGDVLHLNVVGAHFFRTAGGRMLLGREFDERDAFGPPVVIVNEAFARHYFPDSTALGKRISCCKNKQLEIVGVVKNVKYRDLRQEFPPTVYFATGQSPQWHSFYVRSPLGADGVARAIEGAVARVDNALKVTDLSSLEDHMAKSLLRERMLALLAGFFGLLALVLSAVGVYGVMAFQVERRTKEVGIRIALGARPREVLRMLVREAGGLVVFGSCLGLAASLAAVGVTEKLIFGLKPTDPSTFVLAFGVLALVALTAALIPGRRAARVNPADTLRYE